MNKNLLIFPKISNPRGALTFIQFPEQIPLEIQRIVGHTGKITWDNNKPDGTPHKLMDINKMSNAGWKAKISLEEGIKATYQWFLENVANFK